MPNPNPATRYSHPGAATITHLTAPITAVSTSFTVNDSAGWPDGSQGHFFVVLSKGLGNEEKVLVATRTGNTCAISGGVAGRGQDGTSAQDHDPDVPLSVYPCITAFEIDLLNAHAASASAVHGVAGNVLGTTDAQTLSNKTHDSSNAYAGGALSGTFTGSPTLSGNPTFSGTPVFSGSPNFTGAPTIANFTGMAHDHGDTDDGGGLVNPSIAAGALSGTFTGTPTFSGALTLSGAYVSSAAALFTGGPILERAAAGNEALGVRVNADSQRRLQVQADGMLLWGSGSAVGDTNLFRDAAGNLLRTNDALTVDGVLKHNGGFTVPRALEVMKQTTETLSSNATVQDDDELTLPVEANTKYKVEVYINESSPAAADFKWQFSAPAAATAQGNVSGSEEADASASRDLLGGPYTQSTSGGTGGNSDGMTIVGALLVGANAGNFTFRWAQGTSDAGNTSVRAGSWLRLTKSTS